MTTLKNLSLDFYCKYYKMNNNYSSSNLTPSFSFYAINPFDISTLCPSHVKILKKNCFSQIFMNSSIQPNFDMKNSKIELIFPDFFIFIFIFASISQKWLKKMSLRKFPHNLILTWRIQKSDSFFHIFSSSSSFLSR